MSSSPQPTVATHRFCFADSAAVRLAARSDWLNHTVMDSTQEGAFNARKATLSLDLKSNDGLAKLCEQKSPLSNVMALNTSMDITTAQKQYAQGFFDALRSVHNLNNFEFEPKKDGLFSPGYIVPTLIQDLASPFQASTPTSSRELQAILQAMASTPLGGQPPFPFNATTSLTETIQNNLAPSTSASSSSAGTIETRDIKPTIEIKQEPVNLSEDSPDTMSEHSRSSSVALSVGAPHSMRKMGYGMSMDEQERRKLERKRARNRAAASKCRQKKMDRINELEGQVHQEKIRGQQLDAELARIRSALAQLQHLVERHRGCPTAQC